MKAYKGFNADLTCRDFKYEEGMSYETKKAELCSSGFHACERPLDVFGYYPPATSVYHAVNLEEVDNERGNDSKVCAKKITVGIKLSIGDLVKAQVQYTREHCITGHTDSTAATAGDYGAATTGNYGAATAGARGAATAGARGTATAGYYGVATAGDRGVATSCGRSAVKTNGIAVARGMDARAKGGMGAVLVLVKEDECSMEMIAWKAAVVDGNKIKPNTWYKLENGEFVKVDEQYES